MAMAAYSANSLSHNATAHCSSVTRHSSLLPATSWRHHQRRLASLRSSSLAFSPLQARLAGRRPGVKFVVMATEDSFDPNKLVEDALKGLQEAWDKTEDKLALGSLGFAAFLFVWASTGLVSAIDKLPLIPSVFELVGILFSVWFVYRYLLFKPDREELLKKINDSFAKITGSDVQE